MSLTKEQAIELAESGWWEQLTDREIVQFQLYEKRLCMPFGRFHKAIETELGRPIWTHEFVDTDSLRAEFEGRVEAPNMETIIAKLANKVPVIGVVLEKEQTNVE